MHSDEKHCHCVTLSLKVKVIAKKQRPMPQGAINLPPPPPHKINSDSPVYCCATDLSKYDMNDLLKITEKGQQRSRVIR